MSCTIFSTGFVSPQRLNSHHVQVLQYLNVFSLQLLLLSLVVYCQTTASSFQLQDLQCTLFDDDSIIISIHIIRLWFKSTMDTKGASSHPGLWLCSSRVPGSCMAVPFSTVFHLWQPWRTGNSADFPPAVTFHLEVS